MTASWPQGVSCVQIRPKLRMTVLKFNISVAVTVLCVVLERGAEEEEGWRELYLLCFWHSGRALLLFIAV